MRLLPDDPNQALRCRRILIAVAAYCLWIVLGGYLYLVGLLRIGLTDLGMSCLVLLLANACFFVMVRSGFNRRFRDPSMTFVQIVVSILFAMWFVAVVEPPARGVTLLLFVSGLFFGVFRLRTREFLALACLAVGLYAALVVWEARALELTGRELRVQIAQGVVLGAVLLWMAFMGGYVARLRSELRAAVKRIEVLAHTDDLTGTESRRSISGELRGALAEVERSSGRMAVCLLDIDHFKQINDEYGHPVGDEVLREFVERVESTLREVDSIARPQEEDLASVLGRFGGEEFLVVLRGTGVSGAMRAAKRIREVIAERTFETSGGPVAVTVSAGVAAFQPGEGEVDLLRRADRALYQAKEQGRNRICSAPDAGAGARASDPG